MRRLLRRTMRRVASVVILAFAIVSAAECIASAMTPEQMACCAGMHGDCGEMAISCCATETPNIQGLVATKPTVAFPPVPVSLAVLTAPTFTISGLPQLSFTADISSAGPPGVPTYLFVSSFRI